MNYDFLQNYNIPQESTSNQYVSSNYSSMDGSYGTYSMQSSASAVSATYYGYEGTSVYNKSYSSSVSTDSAVPQHPERFVPPGKQVTGYANIKMAYKRKFSGTSSGGSVPKKEANIAEISSDGKLIIFFGRDESYPDELNALIHPLSCDLCNVKMNSRISAKDHYESKVHDKGLNAWLLKNYTEKGVSPPTLKRFIKQGESGPDAYYCEACDLKLTSLTHANQHYAGKKHRLVISQRAKPSGAGYYNNEGKWVRTGTKVSQNQYKDNLFGIGEPFQLAEVIAKTKNATKNDQTQSSSSSSTTPPTTTTLADTTTTAEGELKTTDKINDVYQTALTQASNSHHDSSLFCSICNVNVTSAVQMTMHLSGSKHMKKLKLTGVDPAESQTAVAVPQTPLVDNVLTTVIEKEINTDLSDISNYRTPSGQYYCKTCNISMSHLPALEQHLKGKRHLKKQTEEKALAALSFKKQ